MFYFKRQINIFMFCIALFALWGVFFGRNLSAATVLSASLEEILVHSELIFEGRVIKSQPRARDGSRLIQTCVSFEVIDVIKGEFLESTTELCFLGGTVKKITLSVPGMVYPLVGEKGIYFVESMKRPQVHPFSGWNQGHFRIVSDASPQERVLTSDGRPILGLGQANVMTPSGLSTGAARGLVTGDRSETAKAMTKEQFKRTLRSMLSELKP